MSRHRKHRRREHRWARRATATTFGALTAADYGRPIYQRTIGWVRLVDLTPYPRPGNPDGDAVTLTYRLPWRDRRYTGLTRPAEPVLVVR